MPTISGSIQSCRMDKFRSMWEALNLQLRSGIFGECFRASPIVQRCKGHKWTGPRGYHEWTTLELRLKSGSEEAETCSERSDVGPEGPERINGLSGRAGCSQSRHGRQ